MAKIVFIWVTFPALDFWCTLPTLMFHLINPKGGIQVNQIVSNQTMSEPKDLPLGGDRCWRACLHLVFEVHLQKEALVINGPLILKIPCYGITCKFRQTKKSSNVVLQVGGNIGVVVRFSEKC